MNSVGEKVTSPRRGLMNTRAMSSGAIPLASSEEIIAPALTPT